MNINDTVYSPNLVSDGLAPWEGTLGELIGWDVDRWENVVSEMVDRGAITQDEADQEDFYLADYADRMTLDDVRHLADDPNATVTSSNGDSISGAELREKRVAMGVSQDLMAERFGLMGRNRSRTIRAWERGEEPVGDFAAEILPGLWDDWAESVRLAAADAASWADKAGLVEVPLSAGRGELARAHTRAVMTVLAVQGRQVRLTPA